MRIVVCVKQALDVYNLKVDPTTREPQVKGAALKISDFDKNAVEEAVRIKEKLKTGTITVVATGPTVKDAIKEVLALGADDAVLVQDEAFRAMDSFTASLVLEKAIRTLGHVDLILCGETSIDAYAGQVPPMLAERLGFPLASYARKVVAEEGKVVVSRTVEEGEEELEVPLPAVVTVGQEINQPRLPALMQILQAGKKPVKALTLAELGVDVAKETKVRAVKVLSPLMERKKVVFKGMPEETVPKLVEALKKEGLF